MKQEAHYKMGLGETPHCLIWKRCQYSSLEKFEEAFDTALDLDKKNLSVLGQTEKLTKSSEPSNWWVLLFFAIVYYNAI